MRQFRQAMLSPPPAQKSIPKRNVIFGILLTAKDLNGNRLTSHEASPFLMRFTPNYSQLPHLIDDGVVPSRSFVQKMEVSLLTSLALTEQPYYGLT